MMIHHSHVHMHLTLPNLIFTGTIYIYERRGGAGNVIALRENIYPRERLKREREAKFLREYEPLYHLSLIHFFIQ